MADVHDKKTRSYNMSRIKSKDTKPEELVRKYLFSKGLRYRKNDNRYPGHPDIVLPRYKTVVFVHGCFWHRHDGCRYSTTPSSNVDYWTDKFRKNKERDQKEQQQLKELGWRTIIIWECQLKKPVREKNLQNLYDTIVSGIHLS
ncbi:MAG: DNA mismatch endonuclease Vsr [Lachnospiraceae bacterium]|nr:DNA mismatch endonuclease Vsr [Lachnospiraceae bacterium]